MHGSRILPISSALLIKLLSFGLPHLGALKPLSCPLRTTIGKLLILQRPGTGSDPSILLLISYTLVRLPQIRRVAWPGAPVRHYRAVVPR